MKMFVKDNGRVLGPLDWEKIAMAAEKGRISKDATVADDRTLWMSLEEAKELIEGKAKASKKPSAISTDSPVPIQSNPNNGGNAPGMYPPFGGPAQGMYPPPGGPAQGMYPPSGGPAQGMYPPSGGPAPGMYPPSGGPAQGMYPPYGGPAQGMYPPYGGPAQGMYPPYGGPAQGMYPPNDFRQNMPNNSDYMMGDKSKIKNLWPNVRMWMFIMGGLTLVFSLFVISLLDEEKRYKTAVDGLGLVGLAIAIVVALVVALIVYLVWLCKMITGYWRHIGTGSDTTPGQMGGFLFIPIFNFYWIFVAIYGLAKRINAVRGDTKVNTGVALTFCILFIAATLLGNIHPVVAWIIDIAAWIFMYVTFEHFHKALVSE